MKATLSRTIVKIISNPESREKFYKNASKRSSSDFSSKSDSREEYVSRYQRDRRNAIAQKWHLGDKYKSK
jgi:hypothetical protein